MLQNIYNALNFFKTQSRLYYKSGDIQTQFENDK